MGSLPTISEVQTPFNWAQDLNSTIGKLAGITPIITGNLASGQAWVNSQPYAVTSLPGWGFTRALAAYGTTTEGWLTPFASGAPRLVNGRGLLVEGARTNKCNNYNAAPNGFLTGLTKFGDAAATLTEVDDSAALAAAGLQNICPSGKVFKLDNSAGVADAVAWCAGTTANTNAHTASAYVRGGTGSFAQYSAGGSPFGAWAASSSYARRVGTFTPADVSRVCAIVANAGQIVYFILNQLEEGSFASSPIPVAGSSVTRPADIPLIDISAYSPAITYPLTMYARFERVVDTGGNEAQISMDAGASTNRSAIRITATDVLSAFVDNGSQVSVTVAGSVAVATSYRGAGRFQTNDLQIARSGSLGTANNSITMPTNPTTIRLGYDASGAYSFDYLSEFAIIPGAVSDANLQRLTA